MRLNNLNVSIVEDTSDTRSLDLGQQTFGAKMLTQRRPGQERTTVLTKVTNATSELEARREST